MAKYVSLKERLLANSSIEPDTECIIWRGYSQKDGYPSKGDGYGRINITRNGRSLKFATHRVAKVHAEVLILEPHFNFYTPQHKEIFFELYDAYSLCGLSIDHLCENSLCINPDHLDWVYLSVNIWRKKWNARERKSRMEAIRNHVTRHDKMLQSSDGVHHFIRKIKSKSYRKIIK